MQDQDLQLLFQYLPLNPCEPWYFIISNLYALSPESVGTQLQQVNDTSFYELIKIWEIHIFGSIQIAKARDSPLQYKLNFKSNKHLIIDIYEDGVELKVF